MKRAFLAILALALGLLLTGCPSAEESPSAVESLPEASADFCASLTDVSDELHKMVDLVDSNSTVQQLQEQRSAVAISVEQLQQSAGDVEEAAAAQLQQAADSYTSALDSVSPDATLEQASQVFGPASEEFRSEVTRTLGELGCN